MDFSEPGIDVEDTEISMIGLLKTIQSLYFLGKISRLLKLGKNSRGGQGSSSNFLSRQLLQSSQKNSNQQPGAVFKAGGVAPVAVAPAGSTPVQTMQ